jgi:hypothetical protein
VFADVVVAHGQLHTQTEVGEYNRFVVKFAEDHPQRVHTSTIS